MQWLCCLRTRDPTVFIQEAIEDFGTYFESKVTISYKDDGKGVIHIPFDSQQDFSRMKKLLKREE